MVQLVSNGFIIKLYFPSGLGKVGAETPVHSPQRPSR